MPRGRQPITLDELQCLPQTAHIHLCSAGTILSRMGAYAICFVFVVLFVAALGKKDSGPVTCGSVIKLQHKETVSTNPRNNRHQFHLTDALLHRKTICTLTPSLGDLEADSSQ